MAWPWSFLWPARGRSLDLESWFSTVKSEESERFESVAQSDHARVARALFEEWGRSSCGLGAEDYSSGAHAADLADLQYRSTARAFRRSQQMRSLALFRLP
jgi:hypothetical protein